MSEPDTGKTSEATGRGGPVIMKIKDAETSKLGTFARRRLEDVKATNRGEVVCIAGPFNITIMEDKISVGGINWNKIDTMRIKDAKEGSRVHGPFEDRTILNLSLEEMITNFRKDKEGGRVEFTGLEGEPLFHKDGTPATVLKALVFVRPEEERNLDKVAALGIEGKKLLTLQMKELLDRAKQMESANREVKKIKPA